MHGEGGDIQWHRQRRLQHWERALQDLPGRWENIWPALPEVHGLPLPHGSCEARAGLPALLRHKNTFWAPASAASLWPASAQEAVTTKLYIQLPAELLLLLM